MVTLTGASIDLIDSVNDDASLALDGVSEIATAVVGGTTFVYAAGYSDNAIQILELSADGTLTPVGRIDDTAGIAASSPIAIKTFESEGVQYLAIAGNADDGLSVFSLSDSGDYATFVDAIFLSEDPAYNLGQIEGLSILTTGSQTFIYTMAGSPAGIGVFSFSATGGLTSVQNVDDDSTLQLSYTVGATLFNIGSSHYLAASGYNDDGISVFFVNTSTGTLSSVANLDGSADGSLNGAIYSDSAVIGDVAYIYVPAQTGHTIDVIAFSNNELVSVQTIADTSQLLTARHAEVIELGDRLLLAVTARSSDAVQIFDIESNPLAPNPGQLTFLQTVTAPEGQTVLNGASHTRTVTVGDNTFLLTSAFFDDTLSSFQFATGDDLIEGTNAADDLSGGGGDDTLSGLGGNDLMSGGDGGDEMDGGSGNDTMSGGAGDDDLDGGSDDDSMAGGDGGDEMDGGSGNDTMFGGAGDDDLDGGSGDDSMEGGAGADMLRGEDGADLLRGDAGSDWMDGGSGSDTLSGNDGEDTLRGGDDNDAIYGGNDGDAIAGNLGNDYLRGNNGDDAVYGGAGNDDLGGDAGNDTVEGGLGDDLMRGGGDDDLLLGGRGVDTLAGNSGNDTLRGGADNDVLIGGTGTDLMYGDSGADVFVFDNVNQSIHGSARDTIADFAVGVDKVDLSGFAGTLTFVASYTGAGNEVRYSQPTGRLYLDVDGDGASDFSVDLTGNPALTAGDLIL